MRFLLRRCGFLLLTLWAALTVNFFIPRLMPGNPAVAMMARFHGRINPSALKALEVAFGGNNHESLLSQYLQYLRNSVTGRFGASSTFFPLSVSSVIRQAMWWSLGLVGFPTCMTLALCTLDGKLACWKHEAKVARCCC